MPPERQPNRFGVAAERREHAEHGRSFEDRL
jgi:hypothetical protein